MAIYIYGVRSPKSMPSNRSIDLRSLSELESNFVLSKMNIYVTVEDNPRKCLLKFFFVIFRESVCLYVCRCGCAVMVVCVSVYVFI